MVCPSISGGFEVKAIIVLCMRLALAGVFFYAGAVKAGASQQFAVALLPFTFVPPDWTLPLAHGLACTEILAAILLLIPRFVDVGAGLICALCLLFLGVLSWALWNGIIVSCGCFGEDDSPSIAKMLMAVARDVIFLGAAVAVLVLRRNGKIT
jgi:uncharacterized membrane protein YphA (DoxX/SURF4 family)